MKKTLLMAACLLAWVLGAGCMQGSDKKKDGLKVGTDILQEDITEFFYTYENINYNAMYQRYHFYPENGEFVFFHERRERPDEYGPAGEEDVTRKGTIILTDDEQAVFFDLIRNGTVESRKESASSGDRGPWTYLYWNGDESVYQQYSFPSYSVRKDFEEFCESLAERN